MFFSFQTAFELLTTPGPRLNSIQNWLINEIWNADRYNRLPHIDYLNSGEEAVNSLETLIASAAGRIYDELASAHSKYSILNELSSSDTAIVIFDGLSLREIPMIEKLAGKADFTITAKDTFFAAVPSETEDFIERELDCGRIGPSQLQSRKELKAKNIEFIYSGNYSNPLAPQDTNKALLVWSSFPDITYRDSEARFVGHFENIHTMFETAWINIVQQIKGKKRIIITSDHGYIYFGTGMELIRKQADLTELNNYFGNNRNIYLNENSAIPQSDDIYIDNQRQIAVLKGRIKTRSSGEASAKLYKHGGLSLMEMLTPWVALDHKKTR